MMSSCCRRRGSSDTTSKSQCCWSSVVVLVSLLSFCWLYICLVTFNDRDDVNWKGFTKLKLWVNWFMVVIIVSAVLTGYCTLLLLFVLFQVALREKLDLHWLHKFFLFLGVTVIILGVAGITKEWKEEWSTVLLSLQATAPFLQFGFVGALTLLSPFIFECFHRAKYGSKILIVVVFGAISAAIFLCPLLIQSPCLIELDELPEKPKLIGHRGAPMLAPENTMMSFSRSIACGVKAFETDVQLSKDRIPFLMHDDQDEFLLRTTNAKEIFPNQHFNYSSNITWEDLQSLNAGEWFIKTDPFRSVSQLLEEDKEMARNQTIPSLLMLLNLAKQHNISVIFDLYSRNQEKDMNETVNVILNSGINQNLILWLPPVEREVVNMTAPGFIHVYKNVTEMVNRGGNHLNIKYNKMRTEEIRDLRRENVSVNLWMVNERWLFSLLWCAGASSVTTNSCHLLKDVDHPDWIMSHKKYIIIWIAVDFISFLIMIGLYIFHRKTRTLCDKREKKGDNTSAWNEKELAPFLPTV